MVPPLFFFLQIQMKQIGGKSEKSTCDPVSSAASQRNSFRKMPAAKNQSALVLTGCLTDPRGVFWQMLTIRIHRHDDAVLLIIVPDEFQAGFQCKALSLIDGILQNAGSPGGL